MDQIKLIPIQAHRHPARSLFPLQEPRHPLCSATNCLKLNYGTPVVNTYPANRTRQSSIVLAQIDEIPIDIVCAEGRARSRVAVIGTRAAVLQIAQKGKIR